MSINLTAKERDAIEWLRDFSIRLLEGEPIAYHQKVIDQLGRMGVGMEFVSHKEVDVLVRGKGDHYSWVITEAPWYLRGKVSKRYLPFQIKELKELKKKGA